MTTLPINCRECGASAALAIGQAARDGVLHWWESFSCPACGVQTEADGRDDTPPEHRAALLAHEGCWSVVVDASPTLQLLKAVRQSLRVSLEELPALKARLPGVIAMGTKCEMEVLLNQLRRTADGPLPIRLVSD